MKWLRADQDTVRFALGGFYWLIDNESDYCGKFRGSKWRSAHLAPISAALTKMINAVIVHAKYRQAIADRH